MNASSCHDPKMEAYCKEVCKLEDKSHGLKLNHKAQRYNEAGDELAMITSTRGTVPPNAFSRDLLEPSVDVAMGAGVEALTLNPTYTIKALLAATVVTEAKQSSQQPSWPFDWCMPFLDYLVRGKLPEDQAKARRNARWAKSYIIYGKDRSCIDKARWGSFSAASPWKKDRSSSRIYTRGLAVTTRHPEPSSAMPFNKASTRQWPSPPPLSSFVYAMDASFTPSRTTSQLMLCNDSHHLAVRGMGP